MKHKNYIEENNLNQEMTEIEENKRIENAPSFAAIDEAFKRGYRKGCENAWSFNFAIDEISSATEILIGLNNKFNRLQWIDCKNRLPNEFEEVMFFYVIYGHHNQIIKRDIVCGHLAKSIWHICYLFVSIPLNNKVHVTHWMPLPDLPK